MCKSQSEGGQRCAAHTRPAYEAARPGTPEWDDAAAAYASTREGAKTLLLERDTADGQGNIGHAVALENAMRNGAQMREVNEALAAQINAGKEWEPGNGTPHPTGGYDDVQEDDLGSTVYLKEGRLHRMDGPALIDEDGTPEFFADNQPYCKLQCLRPDRRPADCEYNV